MSRLLTTGDQWLVLPAGGGPGPDQTPEGGQAETAAPEENACTPPLVLPKHSAGPGAAPPPLLHRSIGHCVLWHQSHLTPGCHQTLGPGASHGRLLEACTSCP